MLTGVVFFKTIEIQHKTYDNACELPKCRVSWFIDQRQTVTMAQPSYSRDLAPCDFFLFSKLKNPIKGMPQLATINEIK